MPTCGKVGPMLELKYNLMSSAVIGSHAGCDRVASWVGVPGNGEGIDQYWGHVLHCDIIVMLY